MIWSGIAIAKAKRKGKRQSKWKKNEKMKGYDKDSVCVSDLWLFTIPFGFSRVLPRTSYCRDSPVRLAPIRPPSFEWLRLRHIPRFPPSFDQNKCCPICYLWFVYISSIMVTPLLLYCMTTASESRKVNDIDRSCLSNDHLWNHHVYPGIAFGNNVIPPKSLTRCHIIQKGTARPNFAKKCANAVYSR
jgi:hypothetical protein